MPDQFELDLDKIAKDRETLLAFIGNKTTTDRDILRMLTGMWYDTSKATAVINHNSTDIAKSILEIKSELTRKINYMLIANLILGLAFMAHIGNVQIDIPAIIGGLMKLVR